MSGPVPGRSLLRFSWDEPARIRRSRRWRAAIIADSAARSWALRLLSSRAPDDVGDQVDRSPLLQLREQGCRHLGRELLSVAVRGVCRRPQRARRSRAPAAAVASQGSCRGRRTGPGQCCVVAQLLAHWPVGVRVGWSSQTPSAGLAVLRVLHRCVRSGEHESLMPVVAAHHVWRCSARSSNLDDLRRLVGRADNPAVYVKPVSYHRVHGHPPQRLRLQECTLGHLLRKRNKPPKPGAPGISGSPQPLANG